MNNELQVWESSEKLTEIKQIFAPKLTPLEFSTFVGMGKAMDLNPFLKEVWAVKYGDTPAQIFVGRDGYRKSAQRHPEYDYHQVDAVYSNDTFEVQNLEIRHAYSMKDRGNIVGAYCLVKRKSASKPIYAFVELKEYNKGQSVWKEKPATMIKKVAEAQGLRMAFQELFAGTYDESEDWHVKKENQLPKMSLKEKIAMNSVPAIDISSEGLSTKQVCELIEAAKTPSELKSAGEQAKYLSESDKESVRAMYKARKDVLLAQETLRVADELERLPPKMESENPPNPAA